VTDVTSQPEERRPGRLEERKRTTYLVGVVLGLPIVVTVGWLRWGDEPLVTLVYPLLGVTLIGLGIGLWRRILDTRTAERTVLLVLPLMWFARLATLLYLAPDSTAARDVVTESIGPGMAVIVLLIYLATDTRTGAWMSAAVLGGFGLLIGPWIAGQLLFDGDGEAALAIARIGVWVTVIAGMAFVLASLKEQVAEQRARAEDLDVLASTDPLTGIANRRSATTTLSMRLSEAERYRQPLAITLVDLDRFKAVNDLAGHAAGDLALRSVAQALDTDLRSADVLARWGGDELLVISPHTTMEDARRSAERWRQLLVDLDIGVRDVQVTGSIGVAVSRTGDTVDSLVQRADEAMYRAKAQGGNRVVASDTSESDVGIDSDEVTGDIAPTIIELPELVTHPTHRQSWPRRGRRAAHAPTRHH
jgi:diguanylate cyclase (GGDEF)-like protein